MSKEAVEIAETIRRRLLSHTNVGSFTSDEELRAIVTAVITLQAKFDEAPVVHGSGLFGVWIIKGENKLSKECEYKAKLVEIEEL